MPVDVPQILISLAAIFGIWTLWFKLNLKVAYATFDLLSAALGDKDAGRRIRQEEEARMIPLKEPKFSDFNQPSVNVVIETTCDAEKKTE